MKYLSIDIETTGLNPLQTDILEIGAIVEDTLDPLPREKCPSFHCYIWKENYNCEPYAAAMNVRIFTKILELRKSRSPLLITPEEVVPTFSHFLHKHFGGDDITLAGKNLGSFDLRFLEQLPEWKSIPNRFRHRTLDPSVLFVDWTLDEAPPSLTICKDRAHIKGAVTHEALDDAWDVISLFRYCYEHPY